MKILAINASPRRDGTIDRMMDIACTSLQIQGATLEKIYISELQIKPCTACMACREKGDCILPEDGGHLVAGKISDCDGLLIASPVYWGNIPGSLKVLFDRIVYVMMGQNRFHFPVPRQKGKKAVILSACTTNKIGDIFAGQSRGLQRVLQEILGYSGIKIVGKVNRNSTRKNRKLSSAIKNKIEACSFKLLEKK